MKKQIIKSLIGFDFFFIDSQHLEAYRKGGKIDNDIYEKYEENEPNYFNTTKKAFEDNVDRIDPRNLSYEDFIKLHNDLTSHLEGVVMTDERHFFLSQVACDAEGIQEFIDSNLVGKDFLEFEFLGDLCLYQIWSDKKVRQILLCLTRDKAKYENIEDGQVNVLANKDDIIPNFIAEKSGSTIPRIEENVLLLPFSKLDEMSKNVFLSKKMVKTDVTIDNVSQKIYENLCNIRRQTACQEFGLNINKSAEETETILTSILEEYNKSINDKLLELQNDANGTALKQLIGQTMKKISQLHPFTDGNARTTFILSNIILIKLGQDPFYPTIQSIFDMNSDGKILSEISQGQETFKQYFKLPDNLSYTKPTTITEEMYEKLLENSASKNFVTIMSENEETKTKIIVCNKEKFNQFFAKTKLLKNTQQFLEKIQLDRNQYYITESEGYAVIPRFIADNIVVKDGEIFIKPGSESVIADKVSNVINNSHPKEITKATASSSLLSERNTGPSI